jgi:hypothetical protein
MMHPNVPQDPDCLWPGNHNSVIGKCGFFTTQDRTAKYTHNLTQFSRRSPPQPLSTVFRLGGA